MTRADNSNGRHCVRVVAKFYLKAKVARPKVPTAGNEFWLRAAMGLVLAVGSGPSPVHIGVFIEFSSSFFVTQRQ